MSRRKLMMVVFGGLALSLAMFAAVSAARHHGKHSTRAHKAREHRSDVAELHNGGWNNEGGGTVASFTNGVLTINLTGGGTVSGQVTADTEIKCEAANGDVNEGDGDNNDVGQKGPSHDSNDMNGGPSGGGNNEGDGPDSGDATLCTSADLTPGAVVKKAELDSDDGATATFEEIELVK